MTPTIGLVAAFGVFNIAGGVIGFVKAKSRASLLAGGFSGAVLLLCAAGMARGAAVASWTAAAVSVALGARFLMTWRTTRRVMPDLIMILFSAAVLLSVAFAPR